MGGASRGPPVPAPIRPRSRPTPWPSCAAMALARSWRRLERKPLQGRGIVVTRPAGQAERLAALVSAAGGRAFLFPAIEIERLPERPLPRLEEFDLAVFVSPTAAECAFERIKHAGVPVAAVGGGTRRALQALGARDVLAPESGADSEALLALPELNEVAGKRI